MTASMNPALRVVWEPGSHLDARDWWPRTRPGDAGTPAAGCAVAGPGTRLARTVTGFDITWNDPSWLAGHGSDGGGVTVRLARDQLQAEVPPVWQAAVYYGWAGSRLLLSSSIRALAAALRLCRPDPVAVGAFLAAGHGLGGGNVPSLIAGIRRIEPGHTVTFSPARRIRCERHWRPEQAPGFCTGTLSQAVTGVRDHLDQAAARIASVHDRIACLFSGGLDSTLLAATLLRRYPGRVTLLHVGSGLGTPAEAALREHFLDSYGASSTAVDLPPDLSLPGALRGANSWSDFPVSCPMGHAFDAFIEHAAAAGCDVLVTGDGGDEAFTEREQLLTDLLAGRRYRALGPAAGYFAARSGERSTRVLARARARLRFLSGAAPAPPGNAAVLPGLAGSCRQAAAAAQAARWDVLRELWLAGWPLSAAESYLRASGIPEWEPASARGRVMAAASPLASAPLLLDGLSVRREDLIQPVAGFRPKWLLRLAALDRLPAGIAAHPKIGSADGQILSAAGTSQRDDIISLLCGPAARSAGIEIPRNARDPGSPFWTEGSWVRLAAIAAWLESIQLPEPATAALSAGRRPPAGKGLPQPGCHPERRFATTPAASPHSPPAAAYPQAGQGGHPAGKRAPLGPAIAIALLNLLAQALPAAGRRQQPSPAETAPAARHDLVIAAARLACAIPAVSSAPQPASRAIAWYLTLTGTPARVITGTAQGQASIRYWAETRAGRIDLAECETPLTALPPGGRYHR